MSIQKEVYCGAYLEIESKDLELFDTDTIDQKLRLFNGAMCSPDDNRYFYISSLSNISSTYGILEYENNGEYDIEINQEFISSCKIKFEHNYFQEIYRINNYYGNAIVKFGFLVGIG